MDSEPIGGERGRRRRWINSSIRRSQSVPKGEPFFNLLRLVICGIESQLELDEAALKRSESVGFEVISRFTIWADVDGLIGGGILERERRREVGSGG